MKPIEKTIEINAPKERVWDVLIKDELNRQWYAEFMEGSHAVTDWKQGSKVRFLDNDKNGILGRIVENKPYESIVIEYDGEVKNGQDDLESEAAIAMKGTQEIYKLRSENGKTILDARAEMDENFYDMMAAAWDKAAVKIKELAENN
ncbi:MAG: SRPBCC domain-containing protein [Sphingobacteriales bacterium]|nr:MAG: SRPBCC domain-containing protein [Sphingobacteriales bacterium]